MGTEQKETNPKDAVAGGKLPLHLVPDTLEIFAAMGFLEGALKYGKFNWRIAGARASVYIDAVKRHLAKFANGESCDPVTEVPHLASALACIGIIVDAQQCGSLIDDRAPKCPVGELLDGSEALVAHLKELFKDKNPKQWTIEDSPEPVPNAVRWFALDSPPECCQVIPANIIASGGVPQGRVYKAESVAFSIGDLQFGDMVAVRSAPIPFIPVDYDLTAPDSYTEPRSSLPESSDECPDTQRSATGLQYCGKCDHQYCLFTPLPHPTLPPWRFDVEGREILIGDMVKPFLGAHPSYPDPEEITSIAIEGQYFLTGNRGGCWENLKDGKPHLLIVSR